MGRQCTVCNHKDVDEINRLLLCSDSLRDIARRAGLSKDALARHKERHIPELLSKSNELKADVESFQGNKIRDEIRELKVRALEILEQAQRAGDLRTALLGIREARGCVELFLKAEDRIKPNLAKNLNGENIMERKYGKGFFEEIEKLEGVYRGEFMASDMPEKLKEIMLKEGVDKVGL